jgi:hypothetical protein
VSASAVVILAGRSSSGPHQAAAAPAPPALIGAVPAGLFPLDQAAGQVVLGNYDSDTVEEFAVPTAS